MVTPLLRGAEIDACVHRITLARAEPTPAHRTPVSPEIERRRDEAEHHRRSVVERLVELHPGAVVATGHEHTVALVGDGVELILDARLADVEARRTIRSAVSSNAWSNFIRAPWSRRDTSTRSRSSVTVSNSSSTRASPTSRRVAPSRPTPSCELVASTTDSRTRHS